MERFEFELYQIEHHDDNEEHLFQAETLSAYEAVRRCLDRDGLMDYFVINKRSDGRRYGELSPYAVWKTFEAFESELQTAILAARVQLNLELSKDRATEDLIIRQIEAKG